MFKKIVGGLGFAPETFYNLLLKECVLIIDGDRDRQEQELINMSYAVINGIGCTFGDKKFKLITPYEKVNISGFEILPVTILHERMIKNEILGYRIDDKFAY